MVVVLVLLGLAAVATRIHRGSTEPCTLCATRTSDPSKICQACQATSATEEERRRAEETSEAERRAEQARRESARAEERRRKEERSRVRSLEDLHRLSGSEFESLITSLFVKDGYKVVRRGGSGDEGIDLVLETGNAKDVVQCKRWRADIGSPVIREFYGSMLHAHARHGFIVTTAAFTQSATDVAVGKPITLINGRFLLSWLNGTTSSRTGQSGPGSRKQRANGGFDPYRVLALSRTASKAETRAAYRALIAKYHPDKVMHLGQEFQDIATNKTQEIIRAYEMLTRA